MQSKALSRTSRDETEAKLMTKHSPSYALSHLFLRIVTFLCLSEFAAEALSPRYFHAVAHGPFGAVEAYAWIIICLGSPFYVGFEIWWTRKVEGQGKALLLDGILAAACFFSFWVALVYSFGHYAPF